MPTQAEILAGFSPADIAALYELDRPSDLEVDSGFDANLRGLAARVLAQARLDSERDCRAMSWLTSDGDDVGSYCWWCSILGLDAVAVRPLLLRLTRSQIVCITNGGT